MNCEILQRSWGARGSKTVEWRRRGGSRKWRRKLVRPERVARATSPQVIHSHPANTFFRVGLACPRGTKTTTRCRKYARWKAPGVTSSAMFVKCPSQPPGNRLIFYRIPNSKSISPANDRPSGCLKFRTARVPHSSPTPSPARRRATRALKSSSVSQVDSSARSLRLPGSPPVSA